MVEEIQHFHHSLHQLYRNKRKTNRSNNNERISFNKYRRIIVLVVLDQCVHPQIEAAAHKGKPKLCRCHQNTTKAFAIKRLSPLGCSKQNSVPVPVHQHHHPNILTKEITSALQMPILCLKYDSSHRFGWHRAKHALATWRASQTQTERLAANNLHLLRASCTFTIVLVELWAIWLNLYANVNDDLMLKNNARHPAIEAQKKKVLWLTRTRRYFSYEGFCRTMFSQ